MEKARAGEETDIESFADILKEKGPDCADMINMYVVLIRPTERMALPP